MEIKVSPVNTKSADDCIEFISIKLNQINFAKIPSFWKEQVQLLSAAACNVVSIKDTNDDIFKFVANKFNESSKNTVREVLQIQNLPVWRCYQIAVDQK